MRFVRIRRSKSDTSGEIAGPACGLRESYLLLVAEGIGWFLEQTAKDLVSTFRWVVLRSRSKYLSETELPSCSLITKDLLSNS